MSVEDPRTMADVVREAAADARAQEIERMRLERLIAKPTGTTPADRNLQRLDAILGRALPPSAAGTLQRILDRTLDTLYVEFELGPDAVRVLLAELRDPHRFGSTTVDPRMTDALATLSEVVAACEEAIDQDTTQMLSAAGMSSDALLSGRVAARARKAGGAAAGQQRKGEVAPQHEKWCAAADRLIESGTSPRDVASIVARNSGVTARTVRDALKRDRIRQAEQKEEPS